MVCPPSPSCEGPSLPGRLTPLLLAPAPTLSSSSTPSVPGTVLATVEPLPRWDELTGPWTPQTRRAAPGVRCHHHTVTALRMPGVGARNSHRCFVPRKWHLRWALGSSVSLALACWGAGRTRVGGTGSGGEFRSAQVGP